MPTSTRARAPGLRVRLSAAERHEQLLLTARSVFAERGFEGASVEEIATRAGVSKPVVYEHFGGKDGIYKEVVERETTKLHSAIRTALTIPGARARETLERGALALLDYIDGCPDGFRILSRDSSLANPNGSFASILSDIAMQVEDILAADFDRLGLESTFAPLYAQALVGLVTMTGQQWLETREPDRLVVARHLINLAWNGMAHLRPDPQLLVERLDRERPRDSGDDSAA